MEAEFLDALLGVSVPDGSGAFTRCFARYGRGCTDLTAEACIVDFGRVPIGTEARSVASLRHHMEDAYTVVDATITRDSDPAFSRDLPANRVTEGGGVASLNEGDFLPVTVAFLAGMPDVVRGTLRFVFEGPGGEVHLDVPLAGVGIGD